MSQENGLSNNCAHPFIIGDSFIKNCKTCGLFLPKVNTNLFPDIIRLDHNH